MYLHAHVERWLLMVFGMQAFDLSRVTPSPAMFDLTKLKWLNGQHLRAMSKYVCLSVCQILTSWF
jgi:hypothetical protein